MGDAGDRLAERGHFFGLQKLMVDVARLVVELLALADVPDQAFDAQGAVGRRRVGARGQLHPHGAVVGASQAQQVVGDRAVRCESLEQRLAGLRIDESIAIERADVGFGHVARVSEDQLEMRIGGDGRCAVGGERSDVHALLNRFKEPREHRGALFHREDYIELGFGIWDSGFGIRELGFGNWGFGNWGFEDLAMLQELQSCARWIRNYP